MFFGVQMPLSIFIVHVSFSIVFVYLYAHVVVIPFIAQVSSLSQIPLDEHLSEFFGHVVWIWGIEIVHRDIRNRITNENEQC